MLQFFLWNGPRYPWWSLLPAMVWQAPAQPCADTGIVSCFIGPNFFRLSLCLFKLSSPRFEGFFWLFLTVFIALKKFLLFRARWFHFRLGLAQITWVKCSQLAFQEEVKEDAQERWSCMASRGKWEMLWSPTRLSFSKVASDMGNLLIKRPAKYWKGFYLLLPSSSLKIRPASEAEVVHPQSLGNFDHLGCARADPWRVSLLSLLVTRTQRGEQFPGSFSRMSFEYWYRQSSKLMEKSMKS